MLNWESGRFDYLGSRLTCLFKNQVFAIYEQLWSRGDPFRSRADGTSRQRWLNLRTKVHAGNDGYHAWQVSALMDPGAVTENHWADNAFTLNALREILASAHRLWHPQEAQTYDLLAKTRADLQQQYCDWFRYATTLLDRHPIVPPRRPARLFGEYRGETALDLLVHLLRLDARQRDEKDCFIGWKDLEKIVRILTEFTSRARAYSQNVVMARMHGSRSGPFAPENKDFLLVADKLDEWVLDVIARDKASGNPRLTAEVREARIQLKREARTFNAPKANTAVPFVFVTRSVARKFSDFKFWISGSKSSHDHHARSGRVVLEELVRQLQASQMDYLFELPESSRADAPHLRGEADVVERIICYLLMHRPSAYDDLPLDPDQLNPIKRAPDAYNLFYYVMSLIPVEIQVRTALADTMAEQYHRIYKIGPEALSTTMIQQERLKGIGQELDMTDREFEVQFEDYIAHRRTRDTVIE